MPKFSRKIKLPVAILLLVIVVSAAFAVVNHILGAPFSLTGKIEYPPPIFGGCLIKQLTNLDHDLEPDVTKNYTAYIYRNLAQPNECKCVPTQNPAYSVCNKQCSMYGTAGNDCMEDVECRVGSTHNDDEIFYYAFNLQREFPAAMNAGDEGQPSIYGDKIAYVLDDNYTLIGSGGFFGHVMLYDIATKQTTKVADLNCSSTAFDEVLPRIYDDSIVWTDGILENFTLLPNGTNMSMAYCDKRSIYIYNIPLQSVRKITTQQPAEAADIWGNKIVYETPNPQRGLASDLAIHDLSTGKEYFFTASNAEKRWPKISLTRVTWVEDPGQAPYPIMLHDLSAGWELKMFSSSGLSRFGWLDVSQAFVVWADDGKGDWNIRRNVTYDPNRFLEQISDGLDTPQLTLQDVMPAAYGPIVVWVRASGWPGNIYEYQCMDDMVPELPVCDYNIGGHLNAQYANLTIVKNGDGTANYSAVLSPQCTGRLLQLKEDDCNGAVVDNCTISAFYDFPTPLMCSGKFTHPAQSGDYYYVLCDPRDGQATKVANLTV